MKTLKIEIPEGHEIDIQNSDLTKGIVKFKKIESKYPLVAIHNNNYGYYINSDSIIVKIICKLHKPKVQMMLILLSTKERAEAFLALMQLVELRDSWNKIDNFEADWNKADQEKFVIYVLNNELSKTWQTFTKRVLYFGSAQTRDLFLNTFRDLIETAKELL